MTRQQAGLDFRLARSDDAAQVSHLIGTTWAKYFAYSVTEQDLQDYLEGPVSVARIRRDILDPDNIFLVARAEQSSIEQGESTTAHVVPDSDIVGVVQLVKGTTEPCLTLPSPIELRRVYLSPAHHGTGAASTLLRRAEDLAREHGAASLWLGVWEDNARGIRFYTKEGFESVGEHWFMVGQSKRRDWIMQKAL